jgi:hypothetical protein
MIITRTGLTVENMPNASTDGAYCEWHGEYRARGYYCNCCGFWSCANCYDFTRVDRGRCERCRFRECEEPICNN